VLREILIGSHHFNEIRRGVPRMSPALLSKRLRSLVRTGILMRRDDGNRVRYDLTPGGLELGPIIEALGEWGMRWRSQLGDEDLDPHLLAWDMHRNLNLDAMPAGRVVLAFTFTDVEPKTRDWWIVVEPGGAVDLCDYDPGFDVDVAATSTLRTMTSIWRGDVSWRSALGDGSLVLSGTRSARDSFPHWLKLSAFAGVARPAAAIA
jgi:DNA-binding HxlR family transcriptional regulator